MAQGHNQESKYLKLVFLFVLEREYIRFNWSDLFKVSHVNIGLYIAKFPFWIQ